MRARNLPTICLSKIHTEDLDECLHFSLDEIKEEGHDRWLANTGRHWRRALTRKILFQLWYRPPETLEEIPVYKKLIELSAELSTSEAFEQKNVSATTLSSSETRRDLSAYQEELDELSDELNDEDPCQSWMINWFGTPLSNAPLATNCWYQRTRRTFATSDPWTTPHTEMKRLFFRWIERVGFLF